MLLTPMPFATMREIWTIHSLSDAVDYALRQKEPIQWNHQCGDWYYPGQPGGRFNEENNRQDTRS